MSSGALAASNRSPAPVHVSIFAVMCRDIIWMFDPVVNIAIIAVMCAENLFTAMMNHAGKSISPHMTTTMTQQCSPPCQRSTIHGHHVLSPVSPHITAMMTTMFTIVSNMNSGRTTLCHNFDLPPTVVPTTSWTFPSCTTCQRKYPLG